MVWNLNGEKDKIAEVILQNYFYIYPFIPFCWIKLLFILYIPLIHLTCQARFFANCDIDIRQHSAMTELLFCKIIVINESWFIKRNHSMHIIFTSSLKNHKYFSMQYNITDKLNSVGVLCLSLPDYVSSWIILVLCNHPFGRFLLLPKNHMHAVKWNNLCRLHAGIFLTA